MQSQNDINNGSGLAYPPTRRCDQVDQYFAISIPDPYRWLEDTKSDETRAWVEAQRAFTTSFIESLPGRSEIYARLEQLTNIELVGLPMHVGSRTIYSHNSGLENFGTTLVEEPGVGIRMLFDPNTMSEDASVFVAQSHFSKDGRFVIYRLSRRGIKDSYWQVRDIATCADIPGEVITDTASICWLANSSGIVYGQMSKPIDNPAAEQKVPSFFIHKLGTPQSDDVCVFQLLDHPEWGCEPVISADGRKLIIHIWEAVGGRNSIFYQDLANNGPVVELILDGTIDYKVIFTDENSFWLKTARDAPNGRIIRVDLHKSLPGAPAITDVVPESEDPLSNVSVAGGHFFLRYLHNAQQVIKEYLPDGTFIRTVELPGIGAVEGFNGRLEDTHTYYKFSNYHTPSIIYRYDLATGTSSVYYSPALNFDPNQFETKLIFYMSKDGVTKVPMYITTRKDFKRDGTSEAFLYGYGGFIRPMTPSFSAFNLLLLELGFAFAHAGIRGGGEFGKPWHLAGARLKKQNTFDDFIAGAEWLIENGYAGKKKVVAGGESMGGYLVAECLIQRPDLFGVVCPTVALTDMLRYQVISGNNRQYVHEYGLSENEADFGTLRRVSTVHNVTPGTFYPATLITTYENDTTVPPSHSFKLAAALQACQAGAAPILLRCVPNEGHGNSSIVRGVRLGTDKLAFILDALGIRFPRTQL